MAVAVGLFGTAVLTGSGWQAWMILALFFVESTVLVTVASGSFGQLHLPDRRGPAGHASRPASPRAVLRPAWSAWRCRR